MDRDKALDDDEKPKIVKLWREASPAIVALWGDVDKCARGAVGRGGVWTTKLFGLEFRVEGKFLTIKLPSGRKLFYREPGLTINRFGGTSIKYKSVDQQTRRWDWNETYGAKLVENIVQAISRDILCSAMRKMEAAELPIVLHVHDEAVAEVPAREADSALKTMLDIMAEPISWAPGLPLKGAGFVAPYYQKD